MNTRTQSSVEISSVNVDFGSVRAVNNVSLTIEPGEFFTLLGPSGCGKTTLLRSIAGFVNHTAGDIKISGQSVEGIPPHKRDSAMVFQSYAIFPHLNVYDNIAYGLRAKKVSKQEIDERIREVLRLVNLEGYEDRMPKALSGGQQQRVVIARAVVVRPQVLLMDEPLANLDAKLRVSLREELKELQQSLGITTIYVTHDQEEALSLSDRIAVMSSGEVLQCDTPDTIYERPTDVRVAKFVGEGTFFDAEAIVGQDGTSIHVPGSDIVLNKVPNPHNFQGMVSVGVRPHGFALKTAATSENAIQGTITLKTYYGSFVRYRVECGIGTDVVIEQSNQELMQSLDVGDPVFLEIAPSQIMLFGIEHSEEEL